MNLKVLKISALLSFFTFCKTKAQGITELTGIASIYHSRFEGKKTAAGESFSQAFLTAAHRSFPFNSLVEIFNPETKKSIIVRINDRGPYSRGHLIDISETGARLLGMLGKGVSKVRLRLLRKGGTEQPPAMAYLDPRSNYFAVDSLLVRTTHLRIRR